MQCNTIRPDIAPMMPNYALERSVKGFCERASRRQVDSDLGIQYASRCTVTNSISSYYRLKAIG